MTEKTFTWSLNTETPARLASVALVPLVGGGFAPVDSLAAIVKAQPKAKPVTLSGVVVGVHWRCEASMPGKPVPAVAAVPASEGQPERRAIPEKAVTVTVFNSGEAKLAWPEPKSMRPADSLSQEDLQKWALAVIDRKAIEADLAAQLDALGAA